MEKRGHFLDEKVSGKGSLLILENDHTSYLLHLSGGTGQKYSSILYTFNATNPGGFSTNPGGFSTNPGVFSTNPGGFSTNPGCFSTNPDCFSIIPGQYFTLSIEMICLYLVWFPV